MSKRQPFQITSSPTQQVGASAESVAQAYLENRGFKPLIRNYRTKMGEIDLIMRDKESLVFVEVRARRDRRYGGGLESITVKKQRKIIKTASYYLMKNSKYYQHPCRFDVIEVLLPDQQKPDAEIHWIPAAFNAF